MIALLAWTAALLQGEAASLARTSSIAMPEGARVESALTIDMDADGNADLVIASSSASGRRLSIHLRQKEGNAFSSTPDATLDLTPDVVCFAAADLHADAGREIVLYNAGGVFLWRWRALEESARIQRLFACDFMWQWPDRRDTPAWQASVADIDGDGLEDLAIPEPGKFAIALQRKDADGKRRFEPLVRLSPGSEPDLEHKLGLDRTAEVRQTNAKRRGSISITGGGIQLDTSGSGPGPYLWIQESVPAAQLVDFDGDGDIDVLFLTSDSLEVFVQEPRGAFKPGPLVLKNPVTVDRTRELDVSYMARSLDLDGDKRVDCLISAGDKRAKDVRTQVLVFIQKFVKSGESPLFGRDGAPMQVLVFDGFARPLAFDDVDGDGRPDLVAGAVRPDLIDGLRAAASERIDAELYVYRNTGAGFSKRPDLVQKMSIQAGGLEITARFLGDVTGDGIADLFERADKNALRVHLVKKTKDGFSVIEKPIYEMQLAEDSRLLLPGRIARGTKDIFVLEKEAVRCATFR